MSAIKVYLQNVMYAQLSDECFLYLIKEKKIKQAPSGRYYPTEDMVITGQSHTSKVYLWLDGSVIVLD